MHQSMCAYSAVQHTEPKKVYPWPLPVTLLSALTLQDAHSQCHVSTGTPPLIHAPWVDQVQWARGNALEPQTYAHHLQGAAAVISCVGAFGNQEEMLRVRACVNCISQTPMYACGYRAQRNVMQ